MSWALLEDHDSFVTAWDLISDIAQLENVDLQTAARFFVRLNAKDSMDGTYAIPFYGWSSFHGYFLASEHESQLCIDALKSAVTMGYISLLDDTQLENKITLEEARNNSIGLSFFIKKNDIITEIFRRKSCDGITLSLPKCLAGCKAAKVEADIILRESENKESPKTFNAKARFIKTLLYFIYSNEHMANNPRTYFDDHDSEIRTDFRNSGLKLPTGKTIEKWIGDADIDRLNTDN